MEQLSFEAAKEKALQLLEFRTHSERELADKLRRAGADAEDIERIKDWLREYSLLNDAQYARNKAHDLKKFKKFGRRRIEQELYHKGISSENIAAAIAELDFDDTEEYLYPRVKKKLSGDFERKSIDRCIRYFMYRGYEFSDIKNCIDRVKYEEPEGDDDEF